MDEETPPPLPPILCMPHVALTRASPMVQRIDAPDVVETIRLLERLLVAHEMLSVSAPMIGRRVRVFAISKNLAGGEHPVIFVNPVIVSASPGTRRALESCLSVTKKVAVKRAMQVRVQARNARGELFVVDAGDAPEDLHLIGSERPGFYARVLQHEIDHLNGVTTLRRRG